MVQLQTNKKEIRNTRLIEVDTSSQLAALKNESILVKIEKFAFTSNNITYGVAGDMIGYWDFFTAEENPSNEWGCIPVWGFAEVTKSNVPTIKVGERLYGYFPPSDYLQMQPEKISPLRLVDATAHRKALPPVYNSYIRLAGEQNYSMADDDIRALLWPLHITSFCLCDYLEIQDYLDAKQVIFLSASSKTALGTAQGLMDQVNRPQIIGVTSAANFEFTSQLGCYDTVVTYSNLAIIDSDVKSVIIDMAGNNAVLTQCQKLLGDNMIKSLTVGMTHWNNADDNSSVEPQTQQMKERTEFFFAPAHIQKRVADWGQEGYNQRTERFMQKRATQSKEWMTVLEVKGLVEFQTVYKDIADGKIKPNEGIIVNLN